MLNKILNLFKKPVVQVDQINDKVEAVNTRPVNPQITDSVTQTKQAKEVAAAVKPNVKAKADVQAAKKTRAKKKPV